MRGRLVRVLCVYYVFSAVSSREYGNETLQPDRTQLDDFLNKHPRPIGVLTTTSGAPVDIRDTFTINTDYISNVYNLDIITHIDAERTIERVVHPKGTGAHGYFTVTNDVSRYTSADVFNGIGKETELFVRFSVLQGRGGTDLFREIKGFAIKFYTRQGNLDFLNVQIPVYLYKDPIVFPWITRATKPSPVTNIIDSTAAWDFMTLQPNSLHAQLYIQGDYGIPKGYRKMDGYPIHTYELRNSNGDSYFAKFKFASEQGVENFTSAEAEIVQGRDTDFYIRDLYNAIENGDFPSWRLDMDILSDKDLDDIDYNPFDVTKLWKKGTYKTVTIGRLVLNRNVDNVFSTVEQSAFYPANLVPGIPGPVDDLFKGRRLSYKDSQNYRLSVNQNRIKVNQPKYMKTYNRDAKGPVQDNMKDAPNYYPNSFNGPLPFVDESRIRERIRILEMNSVDLEPCEEHYRGLNSGERQRLAANFVSLLEVISTPVRERLIKLLELIDADLGNRVVWGLKASAGK